MVHDLVLRSLLRAVRGEIWAGYQESDELFTGQAAEAGVEGRLSWLLAGGAGSEIVAYHFREYRLFLCRRSFSWWKERDEEGDEQMEEYANDDDNEEVVAVVVEVDDRLSMIDVA